VAQIRCPGPASFCHGNGSCQVEAGSIPTLAIFRDETLLFMQPGMLPAEALEELISKVKELDMDEVRAEIASQEKKKQN
jgi:hypothetical protein